MSSIIQMFKLPFRATPEQATSQTGITIVTILFGLVISQLALDFSSQIAGIVNGIPYVLENNLDADNSFITLDWKAALRERDLPLLHLLVAASLTVTSAIGYYTSRNLPRLKIRFFNKSFCQFILDVLMVFTYYLVIEFTEATQVDKSAAPETFLVFLAFVLYAIWDFVSLMTSRNPLDQLALRQMPRQKVPVGPRRVTTFVFAFLTAVLALLVNLFDWNSDTAIIFIDVGLIALLVLYRITKLFSYPTWLFRGKIKTSYPTQKPYEGVLEEASVKQILPEIVYRNLNYIQMVAGETEQGRIEADDESILLVDDQTEEPRRMLISYLIDAGIFLPVIQTNDDSVNGRTALRIVLTDYGKAVASVKVS